MSLLHLPLFPRPLFQGTQNKSPYQRLFAHRQGIVFARGPAEIIEAVIRCQNIDIPVVPGNQFFTSSSGVLSKPESLVIAITSLLYSPARSSLLGSCTGSLVP